jgi:hypothetical protein
MAGTQRMAHTASRREPIVIEDLLVWTYRHQRADVVIRRGVGLHDLEAAADGVPVLASSACGCAAVARIGALGVRVDSLGRDRGDLHPDAEVVHGAVQELTGRVHGLPIAHLVISHAARGEAPDAMVGQVPRARPYIHPANGTVRVDWLDAGKRRGVCPVAWAPSWAEIDAKRDEYRAWWHALRALAFALSTHPRLTRYHPLLPAVHCEPWMAA